MGDQDTAARARSFGALAGAYHRHRPGYPGPALDWALAPLAGLHAAALLDLGAGTGKLTASLIGRAASVVAVEPDPEMLRVLRTAVPEAVALAGSAERIPVPSGSMDAVLVGQAFHWFDPGPATAEIARVLRPGGMVAALWNTEDQSVDWVRGYWRLVRGGEATGTARGGQPAARRTGLDTHPSFERLQTREFANPQPTTIDGLLDTLGTYSWISTLEPARRDSTIAAAREFLTGRPETASGAFELPLRTTALRAARR